MRGQQFGHVIAFVESVGLPDPRGEFVRHGCTGLIVLRVVSKDRGIKCPMLIELRWKFDEVPGGGGPGQSGVLAIGEHPVKSVPELVEHRKDVGETNQGGFPFGGLGKVCHVVNDRGGPQ